MFCFFSVDSHYGSLHYKPWQANGLISITAYENKVPSGTVLISSCRWCQLEEQKEKHVTLEFKKKEGMNNHWDYIIPHGFINPVRNPSTPTRNDPEEGQSQSPEWPGDIVYIDGFLSYTVGGIRSSLFCCRRSLWRLLREKSGGLFCLLSVHCSSKHSTRAIYLHLHHGPFENLLNWNPFYATGVEIVS